MRFQIKKLFKKYDYDLLLDQRLNILIGENGCGKSTILKIIKYLLNKDFCSLSKIRFESITISDDHNSLTIYNEDIKKNDIVNQYDFRRRLYDFINNYDFKNIKLNEDTFEIFYEKLIEELSKNAIYEKCNDFDNFTEFLAKDWKLFGFIHNFADEATYISEFNAPYGSKDYFCYIFIIGYCYVNDKPLPRFNSGYDSVSKKINLIIYGEQTSGISKQEVYDFTFFASKNPNKHFNTQNQKIKLLEILRNNQNHDNQEYEFIQEYLNLDQIKNILLILDIIVKNENRYNLWNKPIILENYDVEYAYLKELHRVFEEYCKTDPYDSGQGFFFPGNYDVKVLFDYINNNFESIKDEIFNEKQLVKFQNTVNKYITSKNISFDSELNYVIVENLSGRQLTYDMLSSGEKKIINLFEVVYFGENDTMNRRVLLLDEPELSLSIYWQEMLLEDLLESSFNKIIICTQSPNLLTNDTIKYLVEVKK